MGLLSNWVFVQISGLQLFSTYPEINPHYSPQKLAPVFLRMILHLPCNRRYLQRKPVSRSSVCNCASQEL